MVGKLSSDMATHLYIEEPKKFTFNSYRRSATIAVADTGATSDQMKDLLGWANAKMTTEYISTSKADIIKGVQKLQDTETKDNLGHVNVAEKACKESSKLANKVQRSPKRVRLATLRNSVMTGPQLERSL